MAFAPDVAATSVSGYINLEIGGGGADNKLGGGVRIINGMTRCAYGIWDSPLLEEYGFRSRCGCHLSLRVHQLGNSQCRWSGHDRS